MPSKAITKAAESQPLALPQDQISPEAMEKLIVGHDLSGLNPKERVEYYLALCKSVELNALTRPFAFINMDGKMVLYALKDCTDQIRKRDEVQIKVLERRIDDGLYIVTVEAKNKFGREDQSIGVEALVEPESVLDWHPTERGKKVRVNNPRAGKPLDAAKRANAMMKAETKAKRRATLSLGGLGMPDESDIEAIGLSEPVTSEAQIADIKTEAAKAEEKQAIQQFTEKVAATGGTVVEVQTEVMPPEKKPWREVVIRAGKAGNARSWDKPLGEIPGAYIKFLHDEWLIGPGNAASLKPEMLAALKEAYAELPQDAPETPKPAPTVSAPPPKVKKAAQVAPEPKAEPKKDDGWRGTVVKLEKAPMLHGRTLGEIADAKVGDIKLATMNEAQERSSKIFAGHQWMSVLALDGIPLIRADGNEELVNAITAACDELGINGAEWAKTASLAHLTKEIRRRFFNIGRTTDEDITSVLADTGVLEAGDGLDKLTEALARHVIEKWADVVEAATGTDQ